MYRSVGAAGLYGVYLMAGVVAGANRHGRLLQLEAQLAGSVSFKGHFQDHSTSACGWKWLAPFWGRIVSIGLTAENGRGNPSFMKADFQAQPTRMKTLLILPKYI